MPAGPGTTCCPTSSGRRTTGGVPTSSTVPAANGASRRRGCRWEILDAFRDAAEQCGIPKTDDFNRGDNEGCGYFHVTQRRGVRWTTAKAFLRPAQGRPNLTVLTGAQAEHASVRRPPLHRRRLPPRRPGRRPRPRGPRSCSPPAPSARRSCCSCPASARATCCSGSGIPVRHELPGVGGNLQDHLQLRLVFKVQGTVTLNQRAGSLLGQGGHGRRVRAVPHRAA